MVTIFIEGGGDRPDVKRKCREGFRALLERCGFAGRMPRLVACGSRNEAYDDFRNALAHTSRDDIVMLLVDSEDPVADIDRTWDHLRQRQDDQWETPEGACNEDVLLMTTSMETWIVADLTTLSKHFGRNFRQNALQPLDNLEKHSLEKRRRLEVFGKLRDATKDPRGRPRYEKGSTSYEVLGKLNPDVLEQLPSFSRARRILNKRLRR